MFSLPNGTYVAVANITVGTHIYAPRSIYADDQWLEVTRIEFAAVEPVSSVFTDPATALFVANGVPIPSIVQRPGLSTMQQIRVTYGLLGVMAEFCAASGGELCADIDNLDTDVKYAFTQNILTALNNCVDPGCAQAVAQVPMPTGLKPSYNFNLSLFASQDLVSCASSSASNVELMFAACLPSVLARYKVDATPTCDGGCIAGIATGLAAVAGLVVYIALYRLRAIKKMEPRSPANRL